MESKPWVRGNCIGRGANGTVNMAINLSNGDVFAVKSVNLTSCLPSQLQALENEIKILKSISSPFIVEYLGDDTTSSDRNLHVEYMPLGTVADVGSTEYIESYTWCLVSALSYLHSIGITHCDVKGKNVLLGASPESAKLADFGSAVETPIRSGATRGSPLWMAPEAIRGEYQGPESDVWSLGCTVVEIVTGKPAWEADGAAEMIRRIGWSDELPIFPTRLSSSGRDFLDKCFKRDYRERWSCDQLLCHPFISTCSRKYTVGNSSPRCVLDGFCSNFDGENDEFDENLNFGAKLRILSLASGVGANWELSDEWVEVRGVEEEIHEMINVDLNSNASSNYLLLDEKIFSRMYDVQLYHDEMQIYSDIDYMNDLQIYSNIDYMNDFSVSSKF